MSRSIPERNFETLAIKWDCGMHFGENHQRLCHHKDDVDQRCTVMLSRILLCWLLQFHKVLRMSMANLSPDFSAPIYFGGLITDDMQDSVMW